MNPIYLSGKVAYACESVRTNAEVLKNLCSKIDYEPLIMQANDKQGEFLLNIIVVCLLL